MPDANGLVPAHVRPYVESARVLKYATRQSAAFDLPLELGLVDDTVIEPLQNRLYGTGVRLFLPSEMGGILTARSSMGAKGLHVFQGTIDADYEGEIFVRIMNISPNSVRLKNGDRVAQLLIVPICRALNVEATQVVRLANGFGSTGA